MNWIKCSDEMPPLSKKIIAAIFFKNTKEKRVVIAKRLEDRYIDITAQCGDPYFEYEEVIYWLNIPEYPTTSINQCETCGNYPDIFNDENRFFWVECECGNQTSYYLSDLRAINVWNNENTSK